MADERKDAQLSKLADSSYGVIKMAVAPSGLLYDIIQPEVATLYPELNLAAFSPNDVIQFSNCCTAAMSASRGLPAVSRKVLAFALNRLEDLQTYYIGRTGERFNSKPATVSEFSAAVRLAVSMGDHQAAATIAERAKRDWDWCAKPCRYPGSFYGHGNFADPAGPCNDEGVATPFETAKAVKLHGSFGKRGNQPARVSP